MYSVLWDLSKNVSIKFLAQLLLELLKKDWRNIAVKPDFWGKISIFGRGVTQKILDRFFLNFGTVVSLVDVN